MKNTELDNPKNSLVLFEFKDILNNLINLIKLKRFPKVLMLSGKKGIGKYTLVNHLLTHIFDQDNYDVVNRTINNNTKFYNLNKENLHPSIIYLSGSIHKNIKVEDIRKLKSKILKSSLSNEERFLVFDDIELFNQNSLNALLKIIEEPKVKDNFILINNETKNLIKTIYSRSIEIKLFLSNSSRVKIIENLLYKFNQSVLIDYKSINITPGNFFLFNDICNVNQINIDENFIVNFELILDIYKKNKDMNYINFLLFYTEYYFSKIKKKTYSVESVLNNRIFVLTNINKFVNNSLNQNSLKQIINDKLFNG